LGVSARPGNPPYTSTNSQQAASHKTDLSRKFLAMLCFSLSVPPLLQLPVQAEIEPYSRCCKGRLCQSQRNRVKNSSVSSSVASRYQSHLAAIWHRALLARLESNLFLRSVSDSDKPLPSHPWSLASKDRGRRLAYTIPPCCTKGQQWRSAPAR